MSGSVDERREISARRNRVVFLLERLETPVTVDQIVDELRRDRERRADRPGDDVEWETLHERLHDDDLPALDRAGLLTFDEERGLVGRHRGGSPGHFEAVARLEDGASDASSAGDAAPGDRCEWYFVALALVAAVVLTATALRVGPFARLPLSAVSTGFVAVFVVLSVLNALRHRLR